MEAAVQLGLDKTFDICMPCYGPINMSFSQKLIWFFSFPLTFSTLWLKRLPPDEEAASSSEPTLDHPNLVKGVRQHP
jgi:hypothetical protein